MSRPTKYPWEQIEPMLKAGRSPKYISDRFSVPFNAISNYVKKNKIVVNEVVNEATNAISRGVKEIKRGINEVSSGVNEPNEVKDEILNIIREKIDTLLVDNQLIDGNRKIAAYLQSVIVKQKQNITLQNIKNISGVLKDIESIANPRPETQINNLNAQQNNEQPTFNLIVNKK